MLVMALVLAAGLLFWMALRPGRPRTAAAPAKSSPAGLVENDRANQIYKLPIKDQNLLLKTVEYYCVKAYHRDSCLHHLITCGTPCLVAIPGREREKILNAYNALRQERGLPPLPPTPRYDEDNF